MLTISTSGAQHNCCRQVNSIINALELQTDWKLSSLATDEKVKHDETENGSVTKLRPPPGGQHKYCLR